jgi:hypothetical protein
MAAHRRLSRDRLLVRQLQSKRLVEPVERALVKKRALIVEKPHRLPDWPTPLG